MPVDEAKLNDLLGRFVVDVGAGFQALGAVLGDRLGLYPALLPVIPALPGAAARAAGVGERYGREWPAPPAAGAYVAL